MLDFEPAGRRPCTACHGRKVRCDKKTPFTPCTRGGRICVYPQPRPRARRVKKTTINDVASRVSQLEMTVSAVPQSLEARPAVEVPDQRHIQTSYSGDSAPHSKSETEYRSPVNGEVLLHPGSLSCYFNEVFLSRVIDQVRVSHPSYSEMTNCVLGTRCPDCLDNTRECIFSTTHRHLHFAVQSNGHPFEPTPLHSHLLLPSHTVHSYAAVESLR